MNLTEAEKRVVEAIVKHKCLTRKLLTKKLNIVDGTVANHLTHIYEKNLLPVNNIAGIVWTYYNEEGVKMFDKPEKIKPYKPLPKGHKFARPNSIGQVAKDCINFNWCGKHCSPLNGEDCDCKVLKGEICNDYK